MKKSKTKIQSVEERRKTMKKLLYCSVIASLLSIALFVAAAPAIGFNVVAIPSVEGPIPITEESQAFVPADCSV